MKNDINIMFTCVGRRVSLLKSFRDAAAKIAKKCRICGVDITNLSSAMRVCDAYYTVNQTQNPTYIDELLDIVRLEKINILIPTTDHDLLSLAQNKQKFESEGCFVLVPQPDIVQICQDKRLTYRFLSDNGFNTPKTLQADKADAAAITYPCFLKPWDGYAGRGATVANDAEEFGFYHKRVPNCIVQEYIKGDEITCDVFTDGNGQVRCVVPRKRIEVRTGEVSKAVIVKDEQIIKEVSRLAQTLNTKYCVLTIQLLRAEDGTICFIEINPRFGGGMPLAIKAGANFPLWLLENIFNTECSADNSYRDGLIMLRYDAEVWVESV